MADVSEMIRALRERSEGAGAAIRTLGTGMVADIPAGLGGLASLAGDVGVGRKPSMERAGERVRQLRERYTYEPKSEAGKEAVGAVGKAVEKAGETALKLPGARRARDEWVDFTAQNPALAAGIAGVAGVADPGKGAGRAARTAQKIEQAVARMPIPTSAQRAIPGMELTKQQQLGQALHNLDLLERDPNMRTSAPLEAGGRVMEHRAVSGDASIPAADTYIIRSPQEGELPLGIRGNEYEATSSLETSRPGPSGTSGPLNIGLDAYTAQPYEMGGTPVVLDQLRRYGLMEDANRAMDRLEQLRGARGEVQSARAGLARGERERIGEEVRQLRGQEADPDLIAQETRMREIAQLASSKPMVAENNAVYRWNPERGYEDVGGNRVSEMRVRELAPEQMALRDRAVGEAVQARRQANELRSFIDEGRGFEAEPVTPQWAQRLTPTYVNPNAGADWWRQQLGVTDYKADPAAMNREAVAQFLEDVRGNPAAFQYGVEPPASVRDLEGMAAHFGRQAGKKIDVDIESGYGDSDEPYKIKVEKTHGRGEVMRDRYGDYKQFQKEHERGDKPMYDESGEVKKEDVELVGPPPKGETELWGTRKRVAEGGEPKRDEYGDQKYGFKKSEGGEPVRDERGRQKYTEEENPDYRSNENEQASLKVRGEGGALTVEYPDSGGEASMGATGVGKSEKSPGALLYQTVLADAVRRGIDIGSFGLTSDNQLRLLSNTLSNYARMGENPRSVTGTSSGRAPAARGRAEGPEIMRAEAGETRARIGDEKADRIAFDGENFTVDGNTVDADRILDAVGFKAGSRNVGQKGAMRMAFYEWLRGVGPEEATKAAKGWGKHGAIFTSIVGAAGLGALASQKENENVD